MADTSSIEWTDATWNPTVGCSIVSPGCTNCYAMRQAARVERMLPQLGHYKGVTQPSKAGPVWTGTVLVSHPLVDTPLHWKKPRRIFVNSMSDLFHDGVPDEVIDQVFAIMAIASQHTYQVLTKRADRMHDYLAKPNRLDDIYDQWNGLSGTAREAEAWPLPNVWLGVSAERQEEARQRIPELLATPAARRFVSAEPLLGALDLRGLGLCADRRASRIDWLIAGGESGPKARPSHPDWFRALRDQCQAAGVPFFFKQWGSWQTIYDRDLDDPDWRRCHRVECDTPKGQWLNLAGGQGFHGERVVRAVRTSKTKAGATLDGREWREFP